MSVHEIRIGAQEESFDVEGCRVLNEVGRVFDIPGLEAVRTTRIYRVEGDLTESELQRLARDLFCDPIIQQYQIEEDGFFTDATDSVEAAYRPGVMNPESESIVKAAKDLGIHLDAADSSTEYAFYGDTTDNEVGDIVDRLLVNKTVQQIVYEKPETLLIHGEPGPTKRVPIRGVSDEHLLALSENKLFLSLDEMCVIRNYFDSLGRYPTDCELEIIAARWSEHCGHKTFKAKVIVKGEKKPPLFTRITDTARKYFDGEVISAFHDNAGAILFYDGRALCGKAETHNSPSAIEPYGGAATGSGGVVRDIMGTGQGAKVISSTDMFCFAPWEIDQSELPEGCLHPDYLQRRVVDGGYTMQGLVLNLLDYGAEEIHLLIGIPPISNPCHWGIDFADPDELIYNKLMNDNNKIYQDLSFEQRLSLWLVGNDPNLASRVRVTFQTLDDYVAITRNVPVGTKIKHSGGCFHCVSGITPEGLINDPDLRKDRFER